MIPHSDAFVKRVIAAIVEHTGAEPEEVTATAPLDDLLGPAYCDDLTARDALFLELEDVLGVEFYFDEANAVRTVGDLIAFLTHRRLYRVV